MPAAAAAVDLDPFHPVRGIALGLDDPRSGRPREAGPAAAALELVLGAKKLGAAAGAQESAGPVVVQQRAGEGPLGALLPKHSILLGGQLAPPLLVGLFDLVVHDRG